MLRFCRASRQRSYERPLAGIRQPHEGLKANAPVIFREVADVRGRDEPLELLLYENAQPGLRIVAGETAFARKIKLLRTS